MPTNISPHFDIIHIQSLSHVVRSLSLPVSVHFALSYKYIFSLPEPPPSVSSHPNIQTFPSWQIKPKSLHTALVLADQVPARGLRVFGSGEQHALVARGFFLFADAAGLGFVGGVDCAGRFIGGGEVVDLEGVGGCRDC